MPRSDDNFVYLNVCRYVTWALENKLIEDISGIKNKLILWVNLMIKDLSFSSRMWKFWIRSKCANKNISSYSIRVVQQYSCHLHEFAKFPFKLLTKISRWYKGADVPVHAMKAYGRVAVLLHSFLSLALDGASGRHHGQPFYPWEWSMVPTE